MLHRRSNSTTGILLDLDAIERRNTKVNTGIMMMMTMMMMMTLARIKNQAYEQTVVASMTTTTTTTTTTAVDVAWCRTRHLCEGTSAVSFSLM
jgi:hypothetical protein